MKNKLCVVWLISSIILSILCLIELIFGFTLWFADTSQPWWGPNTILFTTLLFVSIISLTLSIIYFKKTRHK